ncbi:hypothetical protein LI012_06495 [Caldibacillus thermoamylovorans]|uniref:hypothetical protein n=1 Tax=Caldibacillus thermoamylovorans TaxID=35841 RepID=UPI001D08AE59|nr:hypothetical protein [Caldibacillus thermoamylovorans]MCB5934502.1 hypothetical protein [Bacillus sp. DFI.2.34]MCB7076477.1 hypothetical protein [Caldibacillus thermoamylovorans]
MAKEKNIQIKQYNGVDWDSLFPKTKAAVVMLNDGSTVESKVTEIINTLGSKTTLAQVQAEIAKLVNSAPATLDTLKELATALGNDPNFATTIANQLANKVDKVAGKGLSTNDFTTALLNKLNGLPSSVYSKTEVDDKISASTSRIVTSPTEPTNTDYWFQEI